jgi:hypothetical protein
MSARVNVQTGSYTLQPQDDGKLVVINSASATTVTLPHPGSWLGVTFEFSLSNIGTGTVTVAPTSCTIDGQSSITLTQYQGVELLTDGTDYFTVRGISTGGGGGGSTGALTLLENQSASNVAELDFLATLSTDYLNYKLIVSDLFPATDAVSVYIQFSADGGITWDTATTNYFWGRNYFGVNWNDGGTTNVDISTAGLELWNTDLGSTGTIGLSAEFTIFYDPTGTNALKMIGTVIAANNIGHAYFIQYAQLYTGAGPINGFRIITSSGNIASGTVKTYGIS